MLEEEMKKIGKNYPIEIELGNFEFPTKVYGPLSFPAGNYQALNVKIGEAKGKNWWCVMFPPLCFVDIAQGVYRKMYWMNSRKYWMKRNWNSLNPAKMTKKIKKMK